MNNMNALYMFQKLGFNITGVRYMLKQMSTTKENVK